MPNLEESLKETDKKMWTPERPLREIGDKEIRNIFVDYAKYLLNDLRINYLETGYIRNPPETGPIVEKIASRENPKWYRELWKENIFYCRDIGKRKKKRKLQRKRKKPCSCIHRDRVEGALMRMINQKDKVKIGEKGFPKNGYTTDYILRIFMYKEFIEGCMEGRQYFPQNIKVCNYLNVEINERTRKILRKMNDPALKGEVSRIKTKC